MLTTDPSPTFEFMCHCIVESARTLDGTGREFDFEITVSDMYHIPSLIYRFTGFSA